jgi:Zn-finger nucleic acid-binding protein
MQCPRCQQPLKRRTIAEPAYRLVIDACPGCGGLWFGPDQLRELEKIIEPTWIEIRDIPGAKEQMEVLACPACPTPVSMQKAEHERDRKVILDYCPDCRGIWVDHGELEAIQKENWLITVGRILRFISGRMPLP